MGICANRVSNKRRGDGVKDSIEGEVFTVRYPFVRCVYSYYSEDGEGEAISWRPGVFAQGEDPWCGSEKAMADGQGFMVLSVVSTHKPGKYPERVFYTRKFINPDGVEFGKSALRIAVRSKFDRIASGYRCEFNIRERTMEEWNDPR